MVSFKHNDRNRLWLVVAILCFAIAVFFRFALIGYDFMAYTFAGIGILILIYLLLSRLKANTLRHILTVLILIGLILFILVEIPIIASAKTDKNPQADYVIVLGAGVNGTVPSLSMLNRLTATLDYLEKYPDAVAIVSGAQGEGEDISEAEAMATWLEARGIASERIIKEERATSTLENIEFSLEIIKSLGGDTAGRVAIVSSEYHLYRAKLLAKELGCDPVGVAGKTTYPVLKINYFIREAFAVAYLFLFK